MALLKCDKCKGKVASGAITCPHCGNLITGKAKPITPGVNFTTPRVLIFVGVIGVLFVLANLGESGSQTPTPKDSVGAQFSGWDGSHRALVRQVKSRLNDPGSFEHIETTHHVTGNTISIYMKFRARNAFGGMVVNEVLAQAPVSGGSVGIISGL